MPEVTLRVDRAGLDRLAAMSGVISVTEDRPLSPTLFESIPLIGADKTQALGLTGAGSVVAVLDTGVATRHPFLSGRVVHEACFSSTDPAEGASSLCPDGSGRQEGPGSADAGSGPCGAIPVQCDHGTHVAGIAAGNGRGVPGAPPGGVAPGADIFAVQVFSRIDSEATCGGPEPCVIAFHSDVTAGLEKVLDLKESGMPLVAANLSLGGGRFTAACDTEPEKPFVDALLTAGVATVVASGNNGFARAVSSPACISSAVAVGSTTKRDEVSPFSNRGPLLDVFAPGSGILSSSAQFGDWGWEAFSGTSMAAPHVAGAFAVLHQAYPRKNVAQLEALLKGTGKPITYGGITVPRIQLDAAALPDRQRKPRKDYRHHEYGWDRTTTTPVSPK